MKPSTAPRERPRYQQLAAELKQAIASGQYPVGSQLPTEHELCALHEVSRFTARAAIEELVTAGLVTRRQRTGTIVIATPDQANYSLDLASIHDLMQYVQKTSLHFAYVGRVELDAEKARDFGDSAGSSWIYAVGLRRIGDAHGRPIGLTRLFLNPVLDGIEARLRSRKSAVYALIESDYGLVIDRVEQQMSGALLDTDDAANLGAVAGSAALRIERRYFAADGRLLEYADTVHPADRFGYRMVLSR